MSLVDTPGDYLSSLSRYNPLEFLRGDSETYDFFGDPIPSTSKAFSNSSNNISNPSATNSVNTVAVKRGNMVCNPSFEVPAIHPHHQLSNFQDRNFKPSIPATIGGGHSLRSVVTEIPEMFQSVFHSFPYFNVVQSKIMDDVFHSDKSLVVCAPTGSGKTVIFELAIIRLLMHCSECDDSFKIIYMAPIKALCNERYEDWKMKFLPFGLTCFELTGDTDIENYSQLQMVNLIFTTPEKWDSTTRRWRDNRFLVQLVKLFLIDEVHVVNDKNRGATVEAVVSRMMTVHADFNIKSKSEMSMENSIRFVAASATIPNTEDIAEWFGYGGRPSTSQKLGEEFRPVKLRKVVVGYYCPQNWTDFRFDMMLSYKLITIINRYSEGKPSLVFCSTRKGVIQTCSILVKESKLILSAQMKQKLVQSANTIRDNKLKDVLSYGIGFHHAGLDYHDRKIVEELFIGGELPILISTSTLAMGVNLPAHLVIIKSTMYYDNGQFIEYNDTQILQMIGRAGRPQFDTSATAVIMTKDFQKPNYEKFINGTQIIESSLHKKLAEYLNVEIVLKTITDLAIAMQWIRSTFLYVRIMKNPTHYGMSSNLPRNQIEQKLQDMCVKELNSLSAAHLIQMDDDGFDLRSTEAGRLMAQYCVSLNTMKRFGNVKGTETISELLQIISSSEEFCDVQLRTSEKKTLNTLNADKHLQTIRFPMSGRIKNREMKINCLIQAAFGCISIQDWTLSQETTRVLRIGQRLSKCLSEYILIKNDFKLVVSCIILAKCFRTKLWENSKHVARQLEKIGNSLSNNLVNAGLTTFKKIEDTNPRQLELIMNRHPPFGSHVRDAVASLPKYEVVIEQIPKYTTTTADVCITVTLANFQHLKEYGTQSTNPCAMLIIGHNDNKIIFKQKIVHSLVRETEKWSKRLNVTRAQKGHELIIDLINERYVGLDIHKSFTPFYIGKNNVAFQHNVTVNELKTIDLRESSSDDEFEIVPDSQRVEESQSDVVIEKKRRKCGHRCHNKTTCAHECCKIGVNVKNSSSTFKSQSRKVQGEQAKKTLSNSMLKFCTDVKNKSQALPLLGNSRTFAKSSPKVELVAKPSKTFDLQQFNYKAATKSNFPTANCDNIEDDDWADDVDDSYFNFDLQMTKPEIDNLSSRKLNEATLSKEQDFSIPDDDFNEIFKDKDDDVLWQNYEDSNLDFYNDLPEMTAEDFQNHPLEINSISEDPDLNTQSYKFPKQRKLSPSCGFFSTPKARHLTSGKNIQTQIWSQLNQSYSTTTPEAVQNLKTDFVSANTVYKHSEGNNIGHRWFRSSPTLSAQISTAAKCDYETSNVDHRVFDKGTVMDAEKSEKHLQVSALSPKTKKPESQRTITDEDFEKNPELLDAMKTHCHIFSDLF